MPDGCISAEGEANVFKQAYENDLENDVDSIDGDPESERQGLLSPVKANQSARETWELLKQRGRMNRQVGLIISACLALAGLCL